MPEVWGKTAGNHGPWRFPWPLGAEIPLRSQVGNALTVPVLGALLAGMGWIITSNKRAGQVFVFELLLWFVLLYDFYWLID